MTSSQLILVAVTSALISVFTMLFVATLRRARARDDKDPTPVTLVAREQLIVTDETPEVRASAAPSRSAAKTTAAKKAAAKKTTAKKTPARKAPATRKKR